jgi:hypothetical protein
VNEREEPAPANEREALLQIIERSSAVKREVFHGDAGTCVPCNALVDAILAAGYSKSRSPAPAPTLSAVEVDYLLAEEVIQRAVQGLDFAEDAQTVILPVKRCELEGVQMVAYIDGPTLEDLLCKSLDVERYRVVPAGRSPAEVPPNWPDAQRLNWLEGTGESYCNRDRIDRFGAEWLSFDSGAALDANDPTGTHKNIRDAIDAAAGSAAEVPPNEILELCNLVLGGFNEDGDYNGDTKYILALCAAVWSSAQPHD